ncbi:UTRA domain-containing protein, partial [Clostridium botulinum]
EAVLAKDEIAEYLDIDEGMPIILFGCTTYGIVNGKEVPIETFKCYYRTDKFKFYINQIK